jgi:signal transduction histidine kinase
MRPRNLLSQIISATRSLTLEMGLSVLHELGFESGVEWLGEKFQEQYGLRVKVSCEPLPPSLDSAQITFLFRAVRELLTNVTKHAQARHVLIEVKTEDGHFVLRVADDGIGFEVSNTSPRWPASASSASPSGAATRVGKWRSPRPRTRAPWWPSRLPSLKSLDKV